MSSIVDIVITAALIILCFVIIVEKVMLDDIRSKEEILQTQMTTLEGLSKAQQKRYEDEQKNASQQMIKVNQNSKLILAVDMPKNCDAAVQWGITQAKGF